MAAFYAGPSTWKFIMLIGNSRMDKVVRRIMYIIQIIACFLKVVHSRNVFCIKKLLSGSSVRCQFEKYSPTTLPSIEFQCSKYYCYISLYFFINKINQTIKLKTNLQHFTFRIRFVYPQKLFYSSHFITLYFQT